MELSLEIELIPGASDGAAAAIRLRDSLRASLGLTVPVTVVKGGRVAAVRDEVAAPCDRRRLTSRQR
jgi:hypothetical protein